MGFPRHGPPSLIHALDCRLVDNFGPLVRAAGSRFRGAVAPVRMPPFPVLGFAVRGKFFHIDMPAIHLAGPSRGPGPALSVCPPTSFFLFNRTPPFAAGGNFFAFFTVYDAGDCPYRTAWPGLGEDPFFFYQAVAIPGLAGADRPFFATSPWSFSYHLPLPPGQGRLICSYLWSTGPGVLLRERSTAGRHTY